MIARSPLTSTERRIADRLQAASRALVKNSAVQHQGDAARGFDAATDAVIAALTEADSRFDATAFVKIIER